MVTPRTRGRDLERRSTRRVPSSAPLLTAVALALALFASVAAEDTSACVDHNGSCGGNSIGCCDEADSCFAKK